MTALTVKSLLVSLGLDPAKIAVERNLEIVPRSTYDGVAVSDGDRFEIVHFIGGGNAPVDVPRGRQAVRGRGQDLQVAPDRRHRQVQGLCRERRGAGRQRRGDRHRGGAPGESHRSRPAAAGGFHRPEKNHLSAQHRRLLYRRGGRAHPAPGARSGRLDPGQAGSAGREEDCSIPTCWKPCARPRCWPRKASR